MNNPIPLKPERRKPIIKYTMMSFYFLFIGFCAMGIYLKWDALSNQRTYDYEEGFGVSARVPDMDKGPSFLERLTRRNRPKEPPVNYHNEMRGRFKHGKNTLRRLLQCHKAM